MNHQYTLDEEEQEILYERQNEGIGLGNLAAFKSALWGAFRLTNFSSSIIILL